MDSKDTNSNQDALHRPFKFMGITFAPLAIPMDRRMQAFSVWLHVNYLSFTPYLVIGLCAYLLYFGSPIMKLLPVIYATWFVLTFNRMEEGGETIM